MSKRIQKLAVLWCWSMLPPQKCLCPGPWHQDAPSRVLGPGRMLGPKKGVQSPLPRCSPLAHAGPCSLPALHPLCLPGGSKLARVGLTNGRAQSTPGSAKVEASSLCIPSGSAAVHCSVSNPPNPLEGKPPEAACLVSLHRSRDEPIRETTSKHSCLKRFMVHNQAFPPQDFLCETHLKI